MCLNKTGKIMLCGRLNTKELSGKARGLFKSSSLFLAVSLGIIGLGLKSAEARDINYTGNEQTVYVKPGEPTQITFPGKIEGGFKRKHSSLALERQDNYLIVFAQPQLAPEGEAIIVHLDDKRTYSVRALPASDEHPRDGYVSFNDLREPDGESEDSASNKPNQPTGFAPPTVVSGLMREMILVSEFGKQRSIPGYKRSNRYSGETIMHDGALEAKIDEIFMGTDLWGYVIDVENKLETTQKLNPAAFRLDGTRAIGADKWELSARPETAEQMVADAHKGKVYIITRSKRR